MTFTRRQWAALLGMSPLLAQTPPAPAPQEKPEKASTDVREASKRLAEIEVPMDVEPAFRFSA
ncbi:MAG TPA: hypothetical protein VK493_13615 [Bryobacteraceae bacterium]|nr:hypothetical protein [Bryobacteraceae bacterium]